MAIQRKAEAGKVNSVPRVLQKISESKRGEGPSLWGKGSGGGYPWRKK